MLKKIGIGLAAILLLAGCGQQSPRFARSYNLAAPMMLRDARGGASQVFSYSHYLALVMPHDAVKPRFERARDRCLNDAALRCKLITASLTANELTGDEANLVVALPHDKVTLFEKSLLEPLTEDGSGKATVQSRSTSAENVTTQAGDNERKVAQLTAYRDRLMALTKRTDLSVTDLMKVEAELSKVEADLNAALAEKRDVGERIAMESLTVNFGETEPATAPIMKVFDRAGATLTESTAAAIDFLIRIVPWLPIIGLGLVLLGWLWRLVRRKRTQA